MIVAFPGYTTVEDRLWCLGSYCSNVCAFSRSCVDIVSIVLPRSNDHVYICLFVNIEINTLGWHIQQSGVVLKTV